MPLLALQDAELAYGLKPLLDGASLVLEARERVGLIGRNGTGKSSLLKVLAGRGDLDDGTLSRRTGLRVTMVEQEPALPPAPTLREALVARGGLAALGEEPERWQSEARLDAWLDRLGLDGALAPESASGGERKRAALALALALEPELLLLDEPTNHLDIEAIDKLEAALKSGPALVVVTHDRRFLDGVATRIVELDRGLLRSYPGNFADYEARKEQENLAEDAAQRRFEKFWAQEEAWIRQGIEARRTRDAGRVKRLEALRSQRAARRDRLGQLRLGVDSGERSGTLVAELESVSKGFGQREVVHDLSLRLLRGDRLGLIGPNGAGKSTLIRLMLGQLQPDSGRVRLGTRLTIAYFDQLREQLDPERSLGETVSPGSDWVEVNGVRRHVAGYLGDFLFPPERARTPVKALSGGERNRLLLARLFARPANLLVLDEPTNDLDIDSLELLEQLLQDYQGTLLLVSHDRALLDNVVTQSLVAEGGGRWREYAGGYSDWLSQRAPPAPSEPPAGAPRQRATARPAEARRPARKRLSFRESRELQALPGEIEALEREQQALGEAMQQPGYYQREAGALKADNARLEDIERLLAEKFERWSVLESKHAEAD